VLGDRFAGDRRGQLKAFIERTGADELMITSQIFDHAARLRSYEITAEIQRSAASSTLPLLRPLDGEQSRRFVRHSDRQAGKHAAP
jgi:hypothetical protein